MDHGASGGVTGEVQAGADAALLLSSVRVAAAMVGLRAALWALVGEGMVGRPDVRSQKRLPCATPDSKLGDFWRTGPWAS